MKRNLRQVQKQMDQPSIKGGGQMKNTNALSTQSSFMARIGAKFTSSSELDQVHKLDLMHRNILREFCKPDRTPTICLKILSEEVSTQLKAWHNQMMSLQQTRTGAYASEKISVVYLRKEKFDQ